MPHPSTLADLERHPVGAPGLCDDPSVADRLAPLAHVSETRGTPHLTAPDPALPEGHPGRTVVRSRVGGALNLAVMADGDELAYDTKPGTDSSDVLKRSRYGRLPT
jgi:hypothetical protein